MLRKEDKVAEIVQKISRSKEKEVKSRVLRILIEIYKKTEKWIENEEEMEEEDGSEIKIDPEESSISILHIDSKKQREISIYSREEEYRRKISLLKIEELVKVLVKGISICTRKKIPAEDGEEIIALVEGITRNIAVHVEIRSRRKSMEEVFVLSNDCAHRKNQIIVSLLNCINYIAESADSYKILSGIRSLSTVYRRLNGENSESILSSRTGRSILETLLDRRIPNIVGFLFSVVKENQKIDIYDMVICAVQREVKSVGSLVETMYLHLGSHIPDITQMSQYKVYFMQLLFIYRRYYSAWNGVLDRNILPNELVEKTRQTADIENINGNIKEQEKGCSKKIKQDTESRRSIEEDAIDILEGKYGRIVEVLSIETVEKIFQQKSILCTMGTLFHRYIRSTEGLRVVKVSAQARESISSVIALLYKKIDYKVFREVLENREPSGLFYAHCVLLQRPEIILEIEASMLFSEGAGEEILQYTCLLYTHGAKWKEVQKKCKELKKCRKEEEQKDRIKIRREEKVLCVKEENERMEHTEKGRVLCLVCRTDRAVQKYISMIRSKSLLWMIVEEDCNSIRNYLDENARTVSGLSVLLEKEFPKVNILIQSSQSLQHLDPSETFKYPERIRLLPSIEYTGRMESTLKNVFVDEEKRIIWLLFLESVLKEVYQVEKILTEKFHLQVLIRAPTIAKTICQSYSKKREEMIIKLAIEVLEEEMQVTEQEEINAKSTLKTLAEHTQSREVAQDIDHYLRKKQKRDNSQTCLEEEGLEEEEATSFQIALKKAKEIVAVLHTENIYGSTAEAPTDSILFMRKKEDFFNSVKELSRIEEQCIRDYFSNRDISYETHLQSWGFFVDISERMKKTVESLYSLDRDRLEAEDIPENACVHVVNGLVHSIYPEKQFLFLLLTKIIAEERVLSYLEIHAINHGLEYLYAYDREMYRSLDSLCREEFKERDKKYQKECSIDDKGSHKTGEDGKLCNGVSGEELLTPKSWAADSYNKKGMSSSIPQIHLKLKRHGAISIAKRRISLAKYQQEFFNRYYSTLEMAKIIESYLKGVLPLASLQLLVFICRIPAMVEEVLEEIPCNSSRDFLKIFYYACLDLDPPETYPYSGIVEIVKRNNQFEIGTKKFLGEADEVQEREIRKEKEKRIRVEDMRNEAFQKMLESSREVRMYNDRERDEGFLNVKSLYPEENEDVFENEEILRAAEHLSKWKTSIDKTEELAYIFSKSAVYGKEGKYIDFLQAKKLVERFRFLKAVKTGRIYTGSTEIEEILYICPRKNEEICHALNSNRTLTKSGMHRVISVLEQKWLKAPSEVYYMNSIDGRRAVPILDEIVKEMKKKASKEKEAIREEKERQLAANLVIFKIENNMHGIQNPSFLLEKIEKECLERIEKKEGLLIDSQQIGRSHPIERIINAKIPRSSEKRLLFKTIAAKVQYIVKEFEKKPIDILNQHVKPYSLIELEEDSLPVIETLAKTCLTIFNRYAMRLGKHPAKPLSQKAKESRMLQKEREAAKEIDECRAKQYTEVEETAHTLGISLYVQLAEKKKEVQYIISLIHLLFSDHASEKAIESISLENIPIRCFLPLKQQIISKFLHLYMGGILPHQMPLYVHLKGIVKRFLSEFPFAVIYDFLLREPKTLPLMEVPRKIRAHAEAVIMQYKNIYNQVQSASTASGVFPLHTPVLSCTHAEDKPRIYIHKILPEIKRLRGINSPVMVSILGTDGNIYKEILKKNDDLKQDILSTQVFSYMNTVLESSNHTRRLRERIRTYNIVALDNLFGIIEFISGAEPMGSVIEELHKRYYPEEINTKGCREILQKYVESPIDKRISLLKCLYKAYSPVLKKVFTGVGPFDYYRQRKTFTNSFSITSIATYILGLGDRHPNNILLDVNTQELINIDLNLIFDQGKALTISEKVPFRMTQNIQQAIIAEGEYSYKLAMEKFFNALKESKENLLVFMDILQNEPLQRWKAIQKIAQIETMFSDYKSILERLKNKLNGIEDGFVLSNSAHVQYLIQKATDIANLVSIYPGWSPWM